MPENIVTDPNFWQVIWDFAARHWALRFIMYGLLVLATTLAAALLANGIGHQVLGLPKETQLVPKIWQGVVRFVKSAWRPRRGPIATSPSSPSRRLILPTAVLGGLLYGLAMWALFHYWPKSPNPQSDYPKALGLITGFLMIGLLYYKGMGQTRR